MVDCDVKPALRLRVQPQVADQCDHGCVCARHPRGTSEASHESGSRLFRCGHQNFGLSFTHAADPVGHVCIEVQRIAGR